MDLVLWILAVILVVAGILALFRRQLLWGIVLIIVGLLVGPGGVPVRNVAHPVIKQAYNVYQLLSAETHADLVGV